MHPRPLPSGFVRYIPVALSVALIFCQVSVGAEDQPAAEASSIPPTSATATADVAETLKRLSDRIDELESELVEIRGNNAAPEPKANPVEPEELSSAVTPNVDTKGPLADLKEKLDEGWVDLSGEKWNVKLGGHIQADLIGWADRADSITSPLAKNYFEFRRLRLVANGAGYGIFDFRLQLTLEPEVVDQELGTTYPAVKDAYFSINETPIGRLRIGNFFVPFSLEQVTNDTNTVFLERSIPTQGVFAADREPGIALYDCTDAKNVTWSGGIFIDNISDAIQERIDSNMGYRLVGRLTWLPYYDEPSKGRYLLFTGAGILHTNDHDDRIRFRTRPQIHEGPFLIDSGSFAGQFYTTGNVELATVLGPLCVQSEMFLCNVDRNDESPATVYGAYAYATYCLTGENRNFERFGQHGAQFGRFVPRSNFFWTPGALSLGAWEVKGRWSWLGLNELESGQYNDFTFGFNWYWSDHVRILFDWIHPITSQDAAFGSTNSDIIAMRFDCNW